MDDFEHFMPILINKIKQYLLCETPSIGLGRKTSHGTSIISSPTSVNTKHTTRIIELPMPKSSGNNDLANKGQPTSNRLAEVGATAEDLMIVRRPRRDTICDPEPTHEGADVFLSYCVCDTGNKRGGDGIAHRVKAALQSAGLSVFMDDALQGGDDWGTVINKNLRSARTMVPLCSTHFARLRPPGLPMAGISWTLNEVSSFLKLKPHKLVPLLHSGEWPPEELHIECSRIEEVKLSSGFETAMERLIKSIKNKINVPAAAAELTEANAKADANTMEAATIPPSASRVPMLGVRLAALSSLIGRAAGSWRRSLCIVATLIVAIRVWAYVRSMKKR